MKLTDQIRVLLDQLDGAPAGEVGDAPPPGYVYVYPTGPLAKGARHLWPEPEPNNGDGNAWGYVNRCSWTINPKTGQPFIPPGIVGIFPISYVVGATYPECADKFLYPEMWWDQAEVDRQQRMHDEQKARGIGFSPGPR